MLSHDTTDPPISVGAIFQAASNGVPLLCIGRVVGGFAIGICSAIVPVYQAEIAPKNIRGRVVSLQQWAITWGILIQYVRLHCDHNMEARRTTVPF